MLSAPFCEFFPLCISNHQADLTQYLLIDLTDSSSQSHNGSRGVEIKNRHEIFMLEMLFRPESTPHHQGVCDTDHGR